MKVTDRNCLIQLDKEESELWHAFGFLLDELVSEVRDETEDVSTYELLSEMLTRYDNINRKNIELFPLKG